MKSPAPYAIAAALVVLVLAVLYLFSLPVVLWAKQHAGAFEPWPELNVIYGPVLRLVGTCAPYRAILQRESDFLGTGVVFLSIDPHVAPP